MDISMCIRCGLCHEVCPQEAVKHDSVHIPIDVEANLTRAKEAMARDFFDSEEKKQGCLQRWMNFSGYQKKVAEKTLEALEGLKKGRYPGRSGRSAIYSAGLPWTGGSEGTAVAELRVTEQDGISRHDWPVTGGLALAAETVGDVRELMLLDGRNQRLTLQTEALSHWPDGSVRWVLLDFQTDLAAHETKTLRLAKGSAKEPPAMGFEGIVDGEPLPRLATSPRVVGSILRVVDADGEEWRRRETGPTVLERQGPLRVTVRTSGAVVSPQGDRSVGWEARTDFFRRQPRTRTSFTYIVRGGAKDLVLEELAVVVQTEPLEQAKYCFASANAPWGAEMAPLSTSRPGAIIQTDANDSRIEAADGQVLRGQTLKNRGYIGVEADGEGLALGLSEMWQSFPKALRTTSGTLEAALLPREAGSEFALGSGLARTHTLILTSYESPAELDELMTAMNTPILPQMDVGDWNRTGIVPALLSPRDTRYPYIEAVSRAMFTGFTTFSTQANVGVWGLGEHNWGDFRAESYEARQVPDVYGTEAVWGNEEAQVPYGLLIQYLRTGRIEYLLHGLACARHEADVDTIHDSANADEVGAQHIHSARHTTGTITWSHMWTSGIALAYQLTGEGRLKRVLEETGEYLLRSSGRAEPGAFKMRDGGWLLIALCALYQALGDARYLEEGERVAAGLRQWIDQGGKMLLPPAEHVHTPVHLFIALTGVADYWRLTRDPEVEATLLVGGKMALKQGRDEAGFFYVADGQAYRVANRWPTCHSLPVLNALYEITGQRRWIEVGAHQARYMLHRLQADTRWGEEDNWAQGGIYFAYAFAFFETARQLGLLTDMV